MPAPLYQSLKASLFTDGQVPVFDGDSGTFGARNLPSVETPPPTDSSGLINLATGGTASCSPSSPGVAANAFDGDPTTYWYAGPDSIGFGQWVQYDRGAGNEAPLVAYAITTNGEVADTPTAFVLYGSNDGSIWDILDWRSDQPVVTKQLGPFPIFNKTAYRYFRLTITDVSFPSNVGSVYELLLIGGSDSALARLVQTFSNRTQTLGITVSTADGDIEQGVGELQLPAGTLTVVAPGRVRWEPSAGGVADG